jgi:hypothetical protein
MPQDARLPFGYDSSGDVANVNGEDFYYNHALQLAHLAADEIAGGGLADADIRAAEGRIKTQLKNSPFFESPVRVSVKDSDDESFVAEVTVNGIEYPDLPLPNL